MNYILSAQKLMTRFNIGILIIYLIKDCNIYF